MGTNPGVAMRIGWDESEQREFLKAIRQPLMVQTPLQLVIENLFQRLQSQATFMQQMKEKMDRIAVKDVAADELLERIKLLESRQGDAAGPKLNPFNQQEIIARLEALEGQLSESGGERAPRDAHGASAEDTPDLETRLQRLEKRLTGVYNLNGKLVAIEQIAGGLGVSIPDLEYPTGGAPPQTGPNGAAPPLVPLQAWRPPGNHPQQPHHSHQPHHHGAEGHPDDVGAAAWPPGMKVTTRSGSPVIDLAAGINSTTHTRGNSPNHSPRALGSPNSPLRLSAIGSSTPVPVMASGHAAVSAQKVVQMGQEVAEVRAENEALRETVESLAMQVGGLRSGLGSNAVESLSRLQQVEEAVSALRAQVADLSTARRDAAARHGSEVSFADLSLLRSQVEASVAEVKAQASVAVTLAERDLPALTSRVDELADGLRKKGEPRDIDAVFHERINALEASMGDMKTELLGSIEAALESAVKLEELQALEDVLESKAPADALRVVQQQTHALGQAVAGIGEAIAMRPDIGDALRAAAAAPAAAAARAGALATKMRCLTCDQPVSKQMVSMSAGGAMTAKGSFLPRLESMPAKEGLPGGPGLMIAELRASKEERLSGLQHGATGGRGVTLKSGELEDYANGVGVVRVGGSPPRDASPGRAVERSRAARVAVGGMGKPGGAPHSGKPVFL